MEAGITRSWRLFLDDRRRRLPEVDLRDLADHEAGIAHRELPQVLGVAQTHRPQIVVGQDVDVPALQRELDLDPLAVTAGVVDLEFARAGVDPDDLALVPAGGVVHHRVLPPVGELREALDGLGQRSLLVVELRPLESERGEAVDGVRALDEAAQALACVLGLDATRRREAERVDRLTCFTGLLERGEELARELTGTNFRAAVDGLDGSEELGKEPDHAGALIGVSESFGPREGELFDVAPTLEVLQRLVDGSHGGGHMRTQSSTGIPVRARGPARCARK